MSAFKEIVTKAVIGKGKKYYKNAYTIETEHIPTTVLGCWVINHSFSGVNNNGKVLVNGAYDVNVWYSYENNTKTNVLVNRFTYQDTMNIRIKDDSEFTNTSDIIIRSLKQPTCISAKEDGKTINLEIEKELGIEIIGDTKVKISLVEDEETWDDLDKPKTEDLVIDKIDTNYLNKDKKTIK